MGFEMSFDRGFEEVFRSLPETENPKYTSVDGVPYVLHDDHRWLLPIVHFAQQKGALPRPCNIAMFDQHHDSADLSRDKLKRLRVEPSLEGIVSLCHEPIQKNDDRWLKTGMELGMFGDVVIFGVHNVSGANDSYEDHAGVQHKIKITGLPLTGLQSQGHLSDVAQRDNFEPTWKILGWEIRGTEPQHFRFLPGLPKLLLTIDLDCFAIPWSGYAIPWPTKVFEGEFLKASQYRSTEGWTGRSFLQGLAKKAGLVAIARETRCTGGSADCATVLKNLIHYGFDDKFSF